MLYPHVRRFTGNTRHQLLPLVLLVATLLSGCDAPPPPAPEAHAAEPVIVSSRAAETALAPESNPPAPDTQSGYEPQTGDVIFQVSTSPQSLAIQIATGSKWSHVGLVHYRHERFEVMEAAAVVESTPLNEWIARGVGGEFVVKRLVNAAAEFDGESAETLTQAAVPFEGRPYDTTFEWSDDRLYCSELVWKAYSRGLGLELGALRRFREFRLDDPIVQAKLKERWPEGPPLDESVISPADVFDSPLLETVYESGED